MILVMAVTSLVGAAAAWRWGRALIGCTQEARQGNPFVGMKL